MRPNLQETLAQLQSTFLSQPATSDEQQALWDLLQLAIQGESRAHILQLQSDVMALTAVVEQWQQRVLALEASAEVTPAPVEAFDSFDSFEPSAFPILSEETDDEEAATFPETPKVESAQDVFALAGVEVEALPEAPEMTDATLPETEVEGAAVEETKEEAPAVATPASTLIVDDDPTPWEYAKQAAAAAISVLSGFPTPAAAEKEEPLVAPGGQTAIPVETITLVTPEAEPVVVIAEVAAAEPVVIAEVAAAEPVVVPVFSPTPTQALTQSQAPRSINSKFATLSVGLNDRMAFVRHLFNDNPEDFSRVLNQLGTFETLGECDDFVQQFVKPDYDWSNKEEYEKRFMALIHARFE